MNARPSRSQDSALPTRPRPKSFITFSRELLRLGKARIALLAYCTNLSANQAGVQVIPGGATNSALFWSLCNIILQVLSSIYTGYNKYSQPFQRLITSQLPFGCKLAGYLVQNACQLGCIVKKGQLAYLRLARLFTNHPPKWTFKLAYNYQERSSAFIFGRQFYYDKL